MTLEHQEQAVSAEVILMETELQLDMLKLELKGYKAKCERLIVEIDSIDRAADDAEIHDPSVHVDPVLGKIVTKSAYDKMRLALAKARAGLQARVDHLQGGAKC